jgi:hypothetical protein
VFGNEADVSCPAVQSGPPLAARFFTETGDAARAAAAAELKSAFDRNEAARRGDPYVVAPLAEYALAAQRPEEVLTLTDVIAEGGDPWRLREIAGMRIEALLALGRWSDVRRFLEAAGRFSESSPYLAGRLERAEGLVLAAEGDAVAAVERLRSAITAFERIQFPFEAARTRELLAEHVDPAEAGTLRADALSTYERLGAQPHAARVLAAVDATASA